MVGYLAHRGALLHPVVEGSQVTPESSDLLREACSVTSLPVPVRTAAGRSEPLVWPEACFDAECPSALLRCITACDRPAAPMALGWPWWGAWQQRVLSRWVVCTPALLCMHASVAGRLTATCLLQAHAWLWAGSELVPPLAYLLHANLQAEMKEPLRSLVQLPVDAEGLAQRLPKGLRPPGL